MDMVEVIHEEEELIALFLREEFGDMDYQEFFVECTECQQVAKWACMKTAAGIECTCMECDYQETFDSWDDLMELVVESD